MLLVPPLGVLHTASLFPASPLVVLFRLPCFAPLLVGIVDSIPFFLASSAHPASALAGSITAVDGVCCSELQPTAVAAVEPAAGAVHNPPPTHGYLLQPFKAVYEKKTPANESSTSFACVKQMGTARQHRPPPASPTFAKLSSH